MSDFDKIKKRVLEISYIIDGTTLSIGDSYLSADALSRHFDFRKVEIGNVEYPVVDGVILIPDAELVVKHILRGLQ